MAGRIFVTGDCHRQFSKLNKKNFAIQSELDKNDYVIICGDFGGIWEREGESKEEKWWLNWLNERLFTTLFIDGNHENFERLQEYPVEEWHGGKIHRIRPSLVHLMRGQVFDIAGKKIFTFGGASSHDIQDGILELDDLNYKEKKKQMDLIGANYRINHLSWWKEEMPSREEMDEGLLNLKKYDNSVDYIITHCCPSSIQEKFGNELWKVDSLTDYFEKIRKDCKFQKWYFGHYHEDRNMSEREILLYHQVVEIGEQVE